MSLNEVCREMHAASLKAGGDGWLDPQQNRVATPHGFRRFCQRQSAAIAGGGKRSS
jgi:hypothetical protein